jgi:hypothetical protein
VGIQGKKGALEEGDLSPTTLGSMFGSTAKGWFELAQLEGSENWRMWYHPVLPGCGITITVLYSSSICLTQSSRGMERGWRRGEGGLNKYLFQKEKGEMIIMTVYKCTQLRV